MTYPSIFQQNVTSASGILYYITTVVPFFIPMLLFTSFMMVWLGTFFSQKRLNGYADIWSSFSIAGIFNGVLVTVLLIFQPPLVSIPVATINYILAFLGIVILFTGSSD